MRTEPGPGVSLFEHTADIGLDIRGRTLEELFRWAAVGLSRVAAEPGVPPATPDHEERAAGVSVRLTGAPDPEALLVDWLNFLVYVLETRGLLPSGGGWAISVERGAGGTWGLTGSFEGAPLAAGSLRTAVKGATFHGLEIRVSEQGLHRARVILDV
jgi:SHS2 domain-containing protein